MKTPQEKAKALVESFRKYVINDIDGENDFVFSYEEQTKNAKQCALIAIAEIDSILVKSTPKDDPYCFLMSMDYWQEVKSEIEKL
jgi:hypothetical protein